MEEVCFDNDWSTISCEFSVNFSDEFLVKFPNPKPKIAWMLADYFNRTFNVEGSFVSLSKIPSRNEQNIYFEFLPKWKNDWVNGNWKVTPATTAEQKSAFLQLIRSADGEIDHQHGDHSCSVSLWYGVTFKKPAAIVSIPCDGEDLEVSLCMYNLRKNKNKKRGVTIYSDPNSDEP